MAEEFELLTPGPLFIASPLILIFLFFFFVDTKERRLLGGWCPSPHLVPLGVDGPKLKVWFGDSGLATPGVPTVSNRSTGR